VNEDFSKSSAKKLAQCHQSTQAKCINTSTDLMAINAEMNLILLAFSNKSHFSVENLFSRVAFLMITKSSTSKQQFQPRLVD